MGLRCFDWSDPEEEVFKHILRHMMSEHTSQANEQGKGLGLVFSSANDNVSLSPQMKQWMAHWLQTCKTWSSKGCDKDHNAVHVGKVVNQFEGRECLAVEKFNSKKLKPLFLDLNQVYTSGCEGQSSSASGNVDLISHILQSDETVECDCTKFRITDKSRMKSSMELHDELSCRQQKLSYRFSSNKFISVGTKQNIDSLSNSFGISWTSLKDGSFHTLQESSTTDSPCHFSTEEHCKNVKDDSNNTLLLGHKRLTQHVSSDVQLGPSKVPKFSIVDVTQQGSYQSLKSVENGEGFHRFTNTVNSLLVKDELGLDQHRIEAMTGEAAFAHVKKIAFSETFIMPTKQNYGEKETSIGHVEDCCCDDSTRGHGGIGIGTQFTGGKSVSSTNPDNLYHNYFGRSSSTLGETIFRRPMSVASSSQAQEAPSRSADTGVPASSASTKDPTDQISSRIKISDASTSSTLQASESELETCSRWVRRLWHKSVAPTWLQMCDGSSREAPIVCIEPDDKSMPLSDNNNASSTVTEKSLQPQIQSGHRNCHRPAAAVNFLPVDGKKFASIRAMALMGNLIKNYKPRKFHRKEASVIWTV